MIELRLRPSASSPRPRLYGVAGRQLSCDGPLAELEAFRAREPRRGDAESFGRPGAPSPPEAVFRGPVELGPRRYLMDCSWSGESFELSANGLGCFVVGRGGIRYRQAPGSSDAAGPADIALGPSLTLALALEGVFCLHASAVAIDGEALAFVGPSGIGKSTLARALPALSGGRMRCAADDVLPVILGAAGAQALPRFPQLKYPSDRQPGAGVPPALPLKGVYLLDTAEPGSGVGVGIEPMSASAAVLTLVRHTHSARLFSRQLLRQHAETCASLAGRVPIGRLVYPREEESLRRIEILLRQHIPSRSSP